MTTIYPTSHNNRSSLWQEKFVPFLGFLIWPFGSMVAAFTGREKKYAKNLFWLFCIYFGFTFIIANEDLDSARYAMNLKEFHDSEIKFNLLLSLFYSSQSEYIDIVQPILTYITALITDNPSILFAVFACVFGFFYSRNLWYILDRINGNISASIFFFILAYALICPIWYINGIRMWAAAQVFIYGLLPFFYEGRRKSLWWAVSSVFFHFSFIFPLLILFSYIFIKNRPTFFFTFSIITLFISQINLEYIRGLFAYLPGFMQSRISYTDVEGAQGLLALRQELNWYLIFSEQAVKWIIYAFAVIIFIEGKKVISKRKEMMNSFCFGLWFYGWVNLARLVPSGGRFGTVADMFMMTFLIFYLTQFNHYGKIKSLKILSVPVLILFIIIAIRVGFDTCGLYTLLGNPVIAAIYKDTLPVIDYVKTIL
jgi:hypothetical protein